MPVAREPRGTLPLRARRQWPAALVTVVLCHCLPATEASVVPSHLGANLLPHLTIQQSIAPRRSAMIYDSVCQEARAASDSSLEALAWMMT